MEPPQDTSENPNDVVSDDSSPENSNPKDHENPNTILDPLFLIPKMNPPTPSPTNNSKTLIQTSPNLAHPFVDAAAESVSSLNSTPTHPSQRTVALEYKASLKKWTPKL